MRLGERLAHLQEDVDDAAGRQRPVLAHESLEVDAVEILHHVVERALRRAAVVVDGDGVRIGEPRGQLRLALEAPKVPLPRLPGRQQLDRGRPPQHLVLGAIDDAHAALADLLEEPVLAEAPRASHRAAQVERHVRDQRREHDREGGPQRRLRDESADEKLARRVVPEQEERHDGDRGDGDERDPCRAPRLARNERGPAEEDGVQDEKDELVRPPGERHRLLHHRVADGGGDRSHRVEDPERSFREGEPGGEHPENEEHQRRREMKHGKGVKGDERDGSRFARAFRTTRITRKPLDARQAIWAKRASLSAKKSRSPEGPAGAMFSGGSVPRTRTAPSRPAATVGASVSSIAIDPHLVRREVLPAGAAQILPATREVLGG